jgi:hypothetical protein
MMKTKNVVRLPRIARLVAFATLAGTVTVIAAGCGTSAPTIGTAAIESSITKALLVQRGAHTNVTCPAKVPAKKGDVFTCNAVLNVGDYPVSVTETDTKGNVKWGSKAALVILDTSHVSSAIEQSVLAQRGVKSTVTCPQDVLQKGGLSFICNAVVVHSGSKVKAGTYRFRATESDSLGHVRYVGI